MASSIKSRMLEANNAPVAQMVPFAQCVDIPAGLGEAQKSVELRDDFAWLRGKKWPNETVDEKEIIDYLTKENDYCKDFLKSLETHQNRFFETLKSRIKLTDETVRTKNGKYFYYTRTEEALQYSIDCRREGEQGKEEILLDRNKLAEGKAFCRVLGTMVSNSGNLLAYRSDFVGDENYKLTFMRLPSREILEESEKIEQVSCYCFHENPNDESSEPIGLFYSVRNEMLRPTKIFYHKFGTKVEDDVLIFESKNDMFTVSVSKTSDDEYVVIDYHSKTENETFAIDVKKSLEAVKTPVTKDCFEQVCVRPLKDDIEYSADHGGNAWFLKTKEGTKKDHFQIMRKLDTADDFEIILPENENLCISSGLLLTKTMLGVTYLNVGTGQPKLLLYPITATKHEIQATGRQVTFPNVDPELTSHDAAFSGTSNYIEDIVNVAVDTPISPTIWYRYPIYGASASDLNIVKQKEVPNYDSSLYATERIYVQYQENEELALHPSARNQAEKGPATAKTVKIPVTILYKKQGFKKDGSMPLLLNGYGSYGISEEPVFSNLDTLYADLGFVVATAHIRGGGDLGEPWYQAAKFLTKKRTFYDFVTVADHMSQDNEGERWTSPGRIALVGGSAGGMLVGACLNLRPGLLKCIVAHVPFVTVLDTMLDGTLPLTPGEFKEWGNPRDPGYFDYMRSYCPYENVEAKKVLHSTGRYPSIFATTGLSDYRVGYYEGAKWIAKIRDQVKQWKTQAPGAKDGEPLIVMETNMAAGHAGASGRFDRLKEVSRDVAFLVTEFDLL